MARPGRKKTLIIRPYREGDAPVLCRLFFETVRRINLGDYTAQEVAAWAPNVPDAAEWHHRMSSRTTLVAEDESGLLGFVELEEHGCVDMLYCRDDVVRRGVGSALYRAAEQEARRRGLTRLFTEASVTARPFFERVGFRVTSAQTVERAGVHLRNFEMEKELHQPESGGQPA